MSTKQFILEIIKSIIYFIILILSIIITLKYCKNINIILNLFLFLMDILSLAIVIKYPLETNNKFINNSVNTIPLLEVIIVSGILIGNINLI